MAIITEAQQISRQDVIDTIGSAIASNSWEEVRALFLSLMFGENNKIERGFAYVDEGHNVVIKCDKNSSVRPLSSSHNLNSGYGIFSMVHYVDPDTGNIEIWKCKDSSLTGATWVLDGAGSSMETLSLAGTGEFASMEELTSDFASDDLIVMEKKSDGKKYKVLYGILLQAVIKGVSNLNGSRDPQSTDDIRSKFVPGAYYVNKSVNPPRVWMCLANPIGRAEWVLMNGGEGGSGVAPNFVMGESRPTDVGNGITFFLKKKS